MVQRLRGAWSPQNFMFPPRCREDITYITDLLYIVVCFMSGIMYSFNITLLGTSHLKLI